MGGGSTAFSKCGGCPPIPFIFVSAHSRSVSMPKLLDRLHDLRASLSPFESIPFIVHSADKVNQILHMSEALCQHLGYSREDLILRSPSVLEVEDDMNGMEIAVRCGQELVIDDVELRSVNGDIVQTKAHLIPVACGSGQISLFVRIFRLSGFIDPNHSDANEVPLWQSLKSFLEGCEAVSLLKARLLHGLAESHPKAFHIIDNRLPGRPMVWCSTPFYELFGYDASECLGRSVKFLEGAGSTSNSSHRRIGYLQGRLSQAKF